MSQELDNKLENIPINEIENSLNQISAFLTAYINYNDVNLLNAAHKRSALLHKSLANATFVGVRDLVFEIMRAFESLKNQESPNEVLLSALCQSIIILPRYILNHMKPLGHEPQLLLSYINSIRAAQAKPLVSETHFTNFKCDFTRYIPGQFKVGVTLEELGHIRRMYFWSLLDYLKDMKANADHKIQEIKVMKRALIQLTKIHNDDFWVIALAYLENIEQGRVELDIGRKRILADIDRQIQSLNGSQFLNVPEALKKDMLYIIQLGHSKTSYSLKAFALYNLSEPTHEDSYYQAKHAALFDSDVKTVNILIKDIKETVYDLKGVLKSIQGGVISNSVFESLEKTTNRSAALMSACGIENFARGLQKKMDAFFQERQSVNKADTDAFTDYLNEIEAYLSTLSKLPGKSQIEQRLINLDLRVNFPRDSRVSNNHEILHACENEFETIMGIIDHHETTQKEPEQLNNIIPILESIKECFLTITDEKIEISINILLDFVKETISSKVHGTSLSEALSKISDSSSLLQQYSMTLRKEENTENILARTLQSIKKLST